MQFITIPDGLLAQAQDAGGPARVVGDKSMLDHLLSAGPIGFFIIFLSIVAVALIGAHLYQVRLIRLAPPEQIERLRALLSRGKVEDTLAWCNDEENDSFLSRMFAQALLRCSRSPFGFLEMRTALEEAGQEQTARLHRSADAIGLIASVAPMLGLLGTVVGMVGAFETISLTEGFARPDQLAGHISVALITTVLGLLVAIPATAVHAYFRHRVDALAGQVAQIAEDLASRVEHAPGAPTGGRRAASGSQERGARGGAPSQAPPASAARGAT